MQILEKVNSGDGATRILLALEDSARVEAVFLELNDNDKDSLCISSQAGCALACRHCATGTLGLGRNLAANEIAEQVRVALAAVNFTPRRRFDLSYMGMGEPLQNLTAVIDSKDLLREEFPYFTFHLSTVGIVPKMRELSRRAPDIALQISLHAGTDETRSRILPINDVYSLAEVLDAAEEHVAGSDERVVLNYCLIADVNDTEAEAEAVARRVEGRPFHVQLVLFNPHDSIPFASSPLERATRFLALLQAAGVPSHYGRQLGRQIGAGCGQLDADYRAGQLVAFRAEQRRRPASAAEHGA